MTFGAEVLGFPLPMNLDGQGPTSPTSGQSAQFAFIQPNAGTPRATLKVHADHRLRVHFNLTFRTRVLRGRHSLPSQKANHLASIEKSATATSAIVDLEIGLVQMLALLKLVLAARAGKLRGLQIDHVEFDGVVPAASGQGLPLVSVQPNPATGVALIDLYAQLIEHIHLHFAFGALEFAH